jgi:hypothetical protein
VRSGRMRNGESRSAARLGALTSAGRRGGTSAGGRPPVVSPSRGPGNEACALAAGPRAPARSRRWSAGFPSDPS